MPMHHVQVYPSRATPPVEDQLAWKMAQVAADPVPLDSDVAAMIINRVIDNASVAMAAINRGPVANARSQALAHPRPGGATLFGLDRAKRFDPEWAAWANGTAVRELDFHDTFLAADYAHPGDTIPPLLAVAENCGLGGAPLMRGIAAAYELQISLVKGIYSIAAGKPSPNPADDPGIIMAVGFDKLVESSAITFRRRISDDENISDETAEGISGIRQSPIWLSDSGDDVLEMIYVLMFKREDWQVGGKLMDLTIGTYWVNRWQKETASNVWIPDVYFKWRMMVLMAEGEIYFIFGKTDAIAPSYDKTTTAGITGFVGRIGYENPRITGLFEIGYAGGDDAILDDRFTGRPLHRDYNVGLILYEQVLAQRTIEKFAGDTDTQGLWSNGGVYNSTYINPRVKWRPGDFYELRLGLVMAWANKVDGNIVPYLTSEDGVRETADSITESKLLGTEIDFGLHMKWLDEHILISLEAGYMRAGPRLARLSQYQDPRETTVSLPYNAAQYDAIQRRLNNVFTLQSRIAFVF